MKSMIYIFIIAFSSIACASQETKIEKALKKCVNENIAEIHEGKAIDFYEFILGIENEMLASRMVEDNTKKSYLHLFDNLYNHNNYENEYKKLTKIIREIGFDFNAFTINDIIFNQCPYKISVDAKDSEGKDIYTQGVILNRLMAQGFDDKKLSKKLINSIDKKNFNKIVYRAPVILLVMINLNRKYNPAYKKLEEYQEGRKPAIDN